MLGLFVEVVVVVWCYLVLDCVWYYVLCVVLVGVVQCFVVVFVFLLCWVGCLLGC